MSCGVVRLVIHPEQMGWLGSFGEDYIYCQAHALTADNEWGGEREALVKGFLSLKLRLDDVVTS